MKIGIFLLINLFIFLSAIKIAVLIKPPKSRHPMFLDTLTLYLSQIIITETALGLFKRLTPVNLLVLNTAIAVIICFIRTKRQTHQPPAAAPAGPGRSNMLFRLTVLLAAASTIVYLVQAYRLIRLPPMHWDDWTYHLTFPVEWMKSHTLDNPMTVFGDLAPTYSPMNTELINYFLLAPLRSDLLARIGQHIFLGIAVILLFTILGMLGMDRIRASVVSLSFLCLPYLMTQGFGLHLNQTISNDITALAFYLLTILYLIEFRELCSLRNAVLAGLSLGMFIGSKYIAILFCLPLFVLAAPTLLQHQRSRRDRFVNPFVFCLFTLLTGGFSYIRNLVQTGNPMYPAEVRMAGRTVFSGIYKPDELQLSPFHTGFNWLDVIDNPGFDLIGLASLILVFLFSLMLMIGATAGWRARNSSVRGRFRLEIFLLLLPAANAAIFHFLVPYRNMRFLIFVIAAMYLLTAVLNRLNPALFGWILPLMTVGIVTSLITGIRADFHPPDPVNRFPDPKDELALDSGWNWLQRFVDQKGHGYRIAYTGANAVYPLYGEAFNNDVFYVPVNDIGTKAHDYDMGLYRKLFEPDTWLDNLLEYETELLYVINWEHCKGFRHTVEDRWASGWKENFELLYSDRFTNIYRLIDDPLPVPDHQSNLPSVVTVGGVPPVVACPGRLLIGTTWFIPESLRNTPLLFEYTLSNKVVFTGRYPAPGRTRFVIHRMPFETPDDVAVNRQVSAGDQTLAVRISDTGAGRILLASDLASFNYTRADDFEKPAIPQIVSPPDHSVLDGDSRFQWTSSPSAQFYELILSDPDGSSGSFTTSRTDLDVHFNLADHPSMKPGYYNWRIRAVNEFGVRSEFSEERSFLVRERN